MSRGLWVLVALAVLVPAATASAAGQAWETTTPDGVTLRGWVHLPPGPGPFATILEFTPYIDNQGEDASSDTGGFDHLIEAGFALARVSARGTGRSGGCLHFGDQFDVDDVALTIEALAREKWSTGKIGMVGHSYPAWTQDMAVTKAPEPLKAVVPTSGVIDLWSLLTRRGAPLAAGTGILFAEAWTAQTSVINQGAPEHLRCPNLPVDYANNAETATTGDRTSWFIERDLRARMTKNRVPMLRSQGLQPVGEGHIMQVEGLWERLRADRTHFILGQWWHQTPEDQKPEWPKTVIAWFDHYLRGGPKKVATGVVEYQDDSMGWHTADRWPPRANDTVVQLSGDAVVPGGKPAEPADKTFTSADLDPGVNVEAGTPRYAVSACGPHQGLWVSEPVAQDALLAGNFEVDVKLSSTLPGGNFAIFVWKTSGSGGCPDDQATVLGRAMLDLRHWLVEGRSRDFPVGTPTTFTLRSQPFASRLRKGERLVVAAGGGAVEMTPDPLKPVLTLHGATFRLPVVAPADAGAATRRGLAGGLRFDASSGAATGAPATGSPKGGRRCRSRRHFTIRLPRGLVRARVRVKGGRARVIRRGGRRLRARIDMRGEPPRTVRVRVVGVTRSGRRVTDSRRYRTCVPRKRRGARKS